MQNGTAIIHKTDDNVQEVFFDQETIEFAAQNARVEKRQDKTAVDKRNAARKGAHKRRVMDRLANQCVALAIGSAIVAALGRLGLIHWGLAMCLVGVGLVAFGLKLGQWLEWR